MSSSPANPSTPPQAHLRNPKTTVVEATGSQFASRSDLNKPKVRRRPRAAHDFLPKPLEKSPVADPIFTYFQEMAERDSKCCVFLLWGAKNSETSSTWAVDVPIVNHERQDLIFGSLAEKYDEERFWRNFFSFRKFSKVVPVTFRIISRTSSEKFRVSMDSLDLDNYRKIYNEKREKLAEKIKLIAEYDDEGRSETCELMNPQEYAEDNDDAHLEPGEFICINPWAYSHVEMCPVISGSGGGCPVEERDMYTGRVRWIDTASFLSCYFRHPEGARGQSILNGFDAHSFVCRYRAIERLPHWLHEQTRYLKVDGLYIETTWDPVKPLFISLALLISVMVISKISWGSWEVTFGAGSFFVALPMLALTVLSYYEE